MFGGWKNKTGTQGHSGQPNKKAAKGLATYLSVANTQHEATQVEILQKVFHTNYQQMGDKEVIVTIESPPPPPAVDVNPTSPTPTGEEVDDDPIGLTIVFDSRYEPIVSKTFAELVVQERYLESNTNVFNQLVARWGKEKLIYQTRNKSKWTFMMREVLDRLLTPELQAEFNWGCNVVWQRHTKLSTSDLRRRHV